MSYYRNWPGLENDWMSVAAYVARSIAPVHTKRFRSMAKSVVERGEGVYQYEIEMRGGVLGL